MDNFMEIFTFEQVLLRTSPSILTLMLLLVSRLSLCCAETELLAPQPVLRLPAESLRPRQEGRLHRGAPHRQLAALLAQLGHHLRLVFRQTRSIHHQITAAQSPRVFL